MFALCNTGMCVMINHAGAMGNDRGSYVQTQDKSALMHSRQTS